MTGGEWFKERAEAIDENVEIELTGETIRVFVSEEHYDAVWAGFCLGGLEQEMRAYLRESSSPVSSIPTVWLVMRRQTS